MASLIDSWLNTKLPLILLLIEARLVPRVMIVNLLDAVEDAVPGTGDRTFVQAH